MYWWRTPSQIKSIDLIMIASTGDAIDFGDLTDNTSGHCAVSSPTRIVFVEQPSPVGFVNVMEFVTIAALGNATTLEIYQTNVDSLELHHLQLEE